MTSEQINEAIERLRELGEDGRITTSNIIDAIFDGNNYKVRDALIDLLKQADPDTHMELPVDADGVPIHVGDLIYEEGGEPFWVDEMMVNKAKGWEIFGGGYSEGFSAYDPATCRHYHKPTVEDVLREMIDKAGCRHHDDGSCEMGLSNEQIADYARRISEVMADE